MHARFMMAVVWAGIAMLFIACGGKYSDAEKVYTEFADAVETYIQALEKADDGDAVADAINTFSDKIETLAPRMKEINDKYPELKDPDNIPEKLKPIKERSDQMAKQMPGTFMKAMQYVNEEKVKVAFERLGQVMASIGP